MANDKDSSLVKKSIDQEMWREYEWAYQLDGRILYRAYTILRPVLLVIRPGGTTHRIVDMEGVVHCVPAPGHMGCVLRWKNSDGVDPVNF